MSDFVAPPGDRERIAIAQDRAKREAAGEFFTPEQDAQRVTSAQNAPEPKEDWRKVIGTGLERGVAAVIGAPKDTADLIGDTVDHLTGHKTAPLPDNYQPHGFLDTINAAVVGGMQHVPGSGDVNKAIETAQGSKQYEPVTPAGKAAEYLTEFVPAALAPGSMATRALRVATSAGGAKAGETVADVASGGDELAKRWGGVVGGAVGGSAPEIGGAVEVRGNAARDARNAPLRDASSLEQEFGPMTAGERSGNAAQRTQEQNWRLGAGSDTAQSTMRAFDATRAGNIRKAVMGIVTRGKQALSQNAGEAGTILGDELRSARDSLRGLERKQYETGFELAKNEPVAPSDELTAKIGDAANESGYTIPSDAIGELKILQDKIAKGSATQADVERTRQQLNRRLSTAMKARDDATEFVYDDIIGTLDDWRNGLVRDPAAKRAMDEARSISRERHQLYTPQSKIALDGGEHVGRTDLGGRALDRVMNADLTGNQILDALFGAGGKPSAQALGAVRKIRELGTSTISYTNRGAESGVRVPGRKSLNAPVADGPLTPANLDMRLNNAKSAVADDPNAPGGTQLPVAALQSLREGGMHRMLDPLDTYIRRTEDSGLSEGGIIPAQRVLAQLDAALDPSRGRSITELIYTPREIAGLERARKYFTRLSSPAGAAYSGTHGAFRKMMADGFTLLARVVAGPFGPAVREAVLEGRAAGEARKAVAPAKPVPPPGATLNTSRSVRRGAIGAALGAASAEDASDEELLRAIGAR